MSAIWQSAAKRIMHVCSAPCVSTPLLQHVRSLQINPTRHLLLTNRPRLHPCRSRHVSATAKQASMTAPSSSILEVSQNLIERQRQTVLYLTGGAATVRVISVWGGGYVLFHAHIPHTSQTLPWLLTVPGASSTVLDARVPYSTDALTELLGGNAPTQYASKVCVFLYTAWMILARVIRHMHCHMHMHCTHAHALHTFQHTGCCGCHGA